VIGASLPMNAPLNPYASPQPAEPGGLDPNRLLTATFVVDEGWRRKCAAQVSLRQQSIMLRVAWVYLLIGASLGVYNTYFSGKAFHGSPFNVVLGVGSGVFAGLSMWALTLIPLQFWNRFFGKSALPLGPIRITISPVMVTLETASLVGEWHLADLYLLEGRKQALLRINTEDLAILVPATADFGADDYASWIKELARRLVTVAKKN
jgi:hypothetical protein